MGAVFTTKTAPVAPLFLPTMSLSKNEDTAVQTERLSSSDLDAEKAHATEHAERLSELADPDAGKSPEERAAIDRKLMRKVDLWLIPWLCLLYLLSFLDRSNIGNARLAGMEEDLDMGGHDYNNALTIFFISYALAEPITNVLLKRLTPRVFFAGTNAQSLECAQLSSSLLQRLQDLSVACWQQQLHRWKASAVRPAGRGSLSSKVLRPCS